MVSQSTRWFLAILLLLCTIAGACLTTPAQGAPAVDSARSASHAAADRVPASPAAFITVTNTSDSGAGSLRNAISAASPGDTIVFSLTLPATITLLSSHLVVDKGLTINGPGRTLLSISGNNTYNVFHITAGPVSISRLTVRNGRDTSGGGMWVVGGAVQLSDTLIYNNIAADGNGGGIEASGGSLWIMNSTVLSNTANGSNRGGGGIHSSVPATLTNVTVESNQSPSGGGVYGYNTTIVMTNVTMSGNRAVSAKGGGMSGTTMTAWIWNSTIFSNTAATYGGGIDAHGNLTLTNVTLSGNSAAAFSGGGIYYAGGGGISLKNTIVGIPVSGGTCVGVVTSLGHNLDGENGCLLSGTGDITNTNPFLGPLANNGGWTQTMALLPGSRAIDAGDNNGCPATDQRGARRPIGAACDIGAYEAGYLFLPLILK